MPTMSPRTQQMQMGAGAGTDQATSMFESGFSQMAYNVLMSKLPDIVQDVVTFKILDTDVDKGVGVGAFVLMRGDQPLYIPVVMSDNNLKPLEIVYHKALNVFLPLSTQWLEELDKTALNSLGKGVKTPETLYTDVDIRNIVVPPITGRFSYAAWEPVILADVARVISRGALEKEAADAPLMLLQFLRAAPNSVKLGFARALSKNTGVLKLAAKFYGVQALSAALQPVAEKTAHLKEAAKQHFGGGLWIADKDTTPTEFKRIFGDQAAEAYAGVRLRGFAAKDERLNRHQALQEQPYDRWVEPNQPGVYLLYPSDESGEKGALVVPNPIDVFDKGTRYGRRPAVPAHNPLVDNSYYDPEPFGDSNRVYPEGRPDEGEFVTRRRYGAPRYLAILANGDYVETTKLVGRDSVVDEVAGGPLHKRLFQDVSGAPGKGVGVFVRQKGTTIQATVPIEIKSITTDAEGVRRIEASSPAGFESKKLITDPRHPYGTIFMPRDADIAYIPPDFVWVPLKTKLKDREFFTSAHDLAACVSSALSRSGARKVNIKNAGARQFSIDGSMPIDRVPALRKLAAEFVLPVDTADTLLKKAEDERSVTVWVASGENLARAQLALEKNAADDKDKSKPKKKPSGDSAGGGGGAPDMGGDDPMADPAAQAAMMAAAQPPAPPPPSPAELAAMEMQQQIQQEIQKLHEKSEMLAALAARANEIEGGAPLMPTVQTQAMGAPPPSQNLATGQPMPGAMGGGMPGMDPSMGAPGMDPMMGAAPGGAPGMGAPPMPGANPMMGAAPGGAPGMGAPGMDPSMGGGMPGMDPAMMGAAPGGALPMSPDGGMGGGAPPPPMATMGADGPAASAVEQEINPQFLGQAGQLQSADVFDAAAISSLAQSPVVKEMVAQYLPNLEKSLDNLARVLLTLWMQEPDLKSDIGEATFADIEDNVRSTFRNMGDLVLRLSQDSHAMKGQFERGQA